MMTIGFLRSDPNRPVSVREAAMLTGRTPQAIYKLINSGKLPSAEFNGQTYVLLEQVRAAIRADPLAEAQPDLDIEELRTALQYEPATGELVYSRLDASGEPRTGRWAGKPAGTWNAGTRCVVVNWKGKPVAAHYIVWLLHHGSKPDGQIRFVDGDPKNLALANLTEEQGG